MATFVQLNRGWNADPNAPEPSLSVDGRDLLVEFCVNAFQYPELAEGSKATIRFYRCERYRMGPTNDEGWHMGKCRFSKLAPAWGEFYKVSGDSQILRAPADWTVNSTIEDPGALGHYLFYFKDETFECVASDWAVQLPVNRPLHPIACGAG